MCPRVSSSLLPVALVGGLVLALLPAAGAVDETATFKRRDLRSAEELLQQLDEVPVVGLGKSARAVLRAYTTRIRRDTQQLGGTPFPVIDASPLLEIRPDFINLPLRPGGGSILDTRSAVTL